MIPIRSLALSHTMLGRGRLESDNYRRKVDHSLLQRSPEFMLHRLLQCPDKAREEVYAAPFVNGLIELAGRHPSRK